ncbi:hypothetical protein J6590_040768 [Homalodisca vitripennis]|nr:hypothetical protein J6590_040768 [Homalodisca vitripennis]
MIMELEHKSRHNRFPVVSFRLARLKLSTIRIFPSCALHRLNFQLYASASSPLNISFILHRACVLPCLKLSVTRIVPSCALHRLNFQLVNTESPKCKYRILWEQNDDKRTSTVVCEASFCRFSHGFYSDGPVFLFCDAPAVYEEVSLRQLKLIAPYFPRHIPLSCHCLLDTTTAFYSSSRTFPSHHHPTTTAFYVILGPSLCTIIVSFPSNIVLYFASAHSYILILRNSYHHSILRYPRTFSLHHHRQFSKPGTKRIKKGICAQAAMILRPDRDSYATQRLGPPDNDRKHILFLEFLHKSSSCGSGMPMMAEVNYTVTGSGTRTARSGPYLGSNRPPCHLLFLHR